MKVEIGPSHPETFALYGLVFKRIGETKRSLLHFIMRQDDKVEWDELFKMHYEVADTVRFSIYFGLYLRQHQEQVEETLKKYPKGTQFFLEGKIEVDRELYFLREFRDLI